MESNEKTTLVFHTAQQLKVKNNKNSHKKEKKGKKMKTNIYDSHLNH